MSVPVSRKELAIALLEVAQTEKDTQQLAKKIAAYLISEGRAGEIELLARDLERLQHENSGLLEIRVESAHELNDAVRRTIESLFEAKQKVVHESVHKDIIGGVRVRAQDQILDLSVRTRLRQLKQRVKAS